MKMIYQKPSTEWVVIQTEQMIAGSMLQQRGDNLYQDLGNAGETDKTSGNLSRRRTDIWGDEDEE